MPLLALPSTFSLSRTLANTNATKNDRWNRIKNPKNSFTWPDLVIIWGRCVCWDRRLARKTSSLPHSLYTNENSKGKKTHFNSYTSYPLKKRQIGKRNKKQLFPFLKTHCFDVPRCKPLTNRELVENTSDPVEASSCDPYSVQRYIRECTRMFPIWSSGEDT